MEIVRIWKQVNDVMVSVRICWLCIWYNYHQDFVLIQVMESVTDSSKQKVKSQIGKKMKISVRENYTAVSAYKIVIFKKARIKDDSKSYNWRSALENYFKLRGAWVA